MEKKLIAKVILSMGTTALGLATAKWAYSQYRYHGNRVKHYATENEKLDDSMDTLRHIGRHTEPNFDISHISTRSIENLQLKDNQKDLLLADLNSAKSVLGGVKERQALKDRTNTMINHLRVKQDQKKRSLSEHKDRQNSFFAVSFFSCIVSGLMLVAGAWETK